MDIGEHPTFQNALKEGIEQYSQNFGSSRRNNLQFSIWDDFERALATYFQVEAAALCSSGLAAAQIAIQFAQQKGLKLNLAPQAHPALWRHPHKPFVGSYSDWIASHQKGQILASDGIGSPWINRFDLSFAKVYLSIFPSGKGKELIEGIKSNAPLIKHEIAQRTKHQLRRMPKLEFFIDDSLEYMDQIDQSLKGKDNPIKDPSILESIKKTNRVVFIDEDVPGGASAYMMQEVLDKQGAFTWLESPAVCIAATAHRPAYSSDGDYFSKPSVEDVVEKVYQIMHESNPKKFPAL